jgi:hypothetical protein
MVMGNSYESVHLTSKETSYLVLSFFIIYCLGMTYFEAKNLQEIHRIKKFHGYSYDENDLNFDDSKTLIKVILICFIAGVLGGVVGIAGGIILGPVFL